MKKQAKKILPRHAAGSVELKEGTGPITAMCPCGEFLEIYKKDKTFRLRTPETIDPEETNPNVPFVSSPVDDVGSSNPIIARILLQGYEILKAAIFERPINKEAIVLKLHECKEKLVFCNKIAIKLGKLIEDIISEIEEKGIETDNQGRCLNPFPHIPDLEVDCGYFLIHSNHAIKTICEIPSLFFELDHTDTNFCYLSKRLERYLGPDNPLTQFVTANSNTIKYIIKLRNHYEHPGDVKTIIKNFILTPNKKIQVPSWKLSNDEFRPIKEEMFAMVNFLMEVAEGILIHCVMQSVPKTSPYIIEHIEESQVDPNKPIRYRLSIDINRLKPIKKKSNNAN